jgi:uncharacterized protein YcfJ
MFKSSHIAAVAVMLASTAGCQTGQYQAATAPSYSAAPASSSYPSYTREAQCREEARQASANASSSNVGKTAGGAVIGGLVGYAVGRNVTHHGHRYSGAGTAVGTATGAAIGHNMGDNTQAVYDNAYINCMNRY